MKYTVFYFKTVLFQAIKSSISTQFSPIWPIDRTLSGVTTSGQSGPESDGNDGVPAFPKAPALVEPHHKIFVSYPGHSLGEFYSFAEKQSVYSTALADWAT